MRKRLLMLGGCAVLFLLPPYIRTIIEARQALSTAREAAGRGDTAAAIEAYRIALSWNSPGNSAAHEAREEFTRLAASNLEPALKESALRELRRGLRTSRSFLEPREGDDPLIAEIETGLNALSKTPRYLIREQHPAHVNYLFQFLSHLAFWGWVISVLVAIRYGLTATGAIVRRPLLKGLAASFVFYALWIVALANA